MAISLPSDRTWDNNSESSRVKYRSYPGGVASRLSIVIYAAIILYDNSYIVQITQISVIGFMVDFEILSNIGT